VLRAVLPSSSKVAAEEGGRSRVGRRGCRRWIEHACVKLLVPPRRSTTALAIRWESSPMFSRHPLLSTFRPGPDRANPGPSSPLTEPALCWEPIGQKARTSRPFMPTARPGFCQFCRLLAGLMIGGVPSGVSLAFPLALLWRRRRPPAGRGSTGGGCQLSSCFNAANRRTIPAEHLAPHAK